MPNIFNVLIVISYIHSYVAWILTNLKRSSRTKSVCSTYCPEISKTQMRSKSFCQFFMRFFKRCQYLCWVIMSTTFQCYRTLVWWRNVINPIPILKYQLNTGTGGTLWKISWGRKIDLFLGEGLNNEINFISPVWRSSLRVRRSEDSFLLVMITPNSRRFKDLIYAFVAICLYAWHPVSMKYLNRATLQMATNRWPILLVMGNSKSCLLFENLFEFCLF